MKAKPKIIFNTIVMLCLLLGMTAPALASSRAAKTATPVESAVSTQLPDGIKLDVSAPVTPKISQALRDLPLNTGKRIPQGEINRPRGVPETRGTDKKIQDPLAANSLNSGRTPDPSLTFEGTGDLNLYTPPDTTGDVGPDHYVQMVNVKIAIYNKSGVLLYGPADINTLWAGFGGPCETMNDGDPIVLYDDMADRWMISQFAVESAPYYQCVAVSTTPDPTGAYYRYGFVMPDFPDYPKFGVWTDGYYFGTNTGFPNQYWAHALDRASMLAGAAATRISFGGFANLLMPADADGQLPPPAGAPEYFYTNYSEGYPDHPPGVDRLAIYEFDVDWVTPASSTFTLATEIPIAAYNYTVCGFFGPDCIPEPSPGVGLDSLSWWPMVRLQYRNMGSYEAMVSNFTVDLDGSDKAAIRWFELRKAGASPWSLNQEGTYAPDASHRWMGSIAMDGSGNIALGYSVSDATVTKPSIRYAVHQYSDPPGTMQAEAVVINGDGVNTGPYGRWGDYSAMNVDPVDQCTFWYTNEYHDVVEDSFMWNTRVGVFKVPTCSGSLGPTGTLNGNVTDSVSSAPIAGASIAATLSITQTFGATTDPLGDYQMIIPVGTYDVTGSAFGYLPETVSGVNVISGTVTTQDFALDPAPAALVYGYITDATTGWPLYASFDIAGVPGGPFWNDPVTGRYEISLPQGSSYDFSVQAWVPGYTDGFQTVGPLSGDIQVDFALDADLAACTAPGYTIFPYGQNFEANDGGFTHVGTGTWDWGAPTSGPGAAHSGVNVWATNLAGPYNNNENSYIESPDLDMSALAGDSFNFSWWQYLQSEGGFDYASMLVSNNGGSTWTTVYGPLSGSIDLTWTQHTVTLDPSYAVSNFRVRFLFTTDVSVTYNGWYIDDLTSGACIPPVDGGLTVGNVYDANIISGLNGATVTNPVGFATTVPTPGDPNVEDGFYTLFAPAGTHPYTATIGGGYLPDFADVTVLANDTVQQDFFLDAGWLNSVDPTAFDIEVAQGYTLTAPLALFNNGGAVTNFEIKELPRTLQAGPNTALPGSNPETARRIPLEKPSDTAQAAAPLADIIQDGSFEAGTPNPYWEEFSTNFFTPICDIANCGTGGGTAGPRTGAFWAWFGGIDAAYEQGYVRQTLVIPASTATLSFWLWIGTTGGPVEDYFNVSVDGNEVFRATSDQQPLYSTYTEVEVDISAYADGNPHTVELQSETFGTQVTNFNVDDVVLDSTTVTDIPWLSEVPVTGTIDANSTADIAVTFDSMAYTVGTQLKAMLTVASDDPYGSMFEIPVTMTVVTATSYLEVGHLAPFAVDPGTAVTVTLNGEPALINFEYGDSTPYIPLLPGDYDVAVWPAGSTTPAISGTVTLLPLTYYTAIAIGDGVNQPLELLALVDDLTPPAAGKFHLRLGHLAPFASGDALADIRLQDGTPVITDVAFSDVTAFMPMDAGEYDLKVTTPGGAVTLIDPLPVTFNAGDIVSAFATGDGSNQPLGAFAWPAYVEGFFLPLASSGVELSPAEAAQSGAPGEMVTYTLTVTNTGDITDTFGITVTAGWDVHLPVTELTLGAGESAEFVVHVDIPADAADGESDVATVTVMVEGVPSATAESELTTTAETGTKFVYLPLVMDGYNAP